MTHKRASKTIPVLSACCSLLIILAFLLPRLLPFGGDGFAPAASAALLFLTLITAALLLSIVLVAITLYRYRDLPLRHRIAGFAPLVLIALSAFAINMLLTGAAD